MFDQAVFIYLLELVFNCFDFISREKLFYILMPWSNILADL